MQDYCIFAVKFLKVFQKSGTSKMPSNDRDNWSTVIYASRPVSAFLLT